MVNTEAVLEAEDTAAGSMLDFLWLVFIDPPRAFERILEVRPWWIGFALITLGLALIDFVSLAREELPDHPLTALALVVGLAGLLAVVYWPLYTFMTAFGGPRVLNGRGVFSDCMLVVAAAAVPAAIAAVPLLPVEILVIQPHLAGGLQEALAQQHFLTTAALVVNFFLGLWWLALTVWGVRHIHGLSWPRAVLGFFLLPILFALINLISLVMLL
ncbi:YIP1 family protein [bacterium]|nr:YIP1 family protein [candidate division CSSED10-310 bacterium]